MALTGKFMACSKNFFDDIKKELECSVCQEQFSEANEPKILKCLHTFCKNCLEGWQRQHRNGELSCPTCRHITHCDDNDINKLPSNLFCKQLVEIVEAYSGQLENEDSPHCGICDRRIALKFYCAECNCFLCDDSACSHVKGKVFEGHSVKEISRFKSNDVQDLARRANICRKHNDELRYYCDKCKVCICRDCALLEHRDHKFISFDHGLDQKKSEITKRMQEVEVVGCRLQEQKEILEKRKKGVDHSFDQATIEVNRVAEHCISLIRRHEEVMSKELLKAKESFENEFSSQMTNLSGKLTDINSSLEFCRDILERNNLPEILNVEETLERRFEDFLSPSEFSRPIQMNASPVKYVANDLPMLEKELGKIIFSNTDPSMSIAQGKGLSEGLQSDDCTFMIITKDWRGETTYSENDLVEVDIQSLRTGEVIKPRICDLKDGCYEVNYKLDDAGEFSVSATIEGEKIRDSPFQLRVEKRAKGKYEKADPFFHEPTNIFEVHPQFMKLLEKVHKKALREIEHKFGVEIVWEENASQVCVRQRKTSKVNHRLKEGCEEFIDLYKNVLEKVSREVVQLPSEVEETVIDETIITVQKENPVVFEKAENTLVVYADKDSIRTYVQALGEKLRLTLQRGRTSKVASQGTLQDQKNQPLQSFSGSKLLLQVLKNGVTLSLYQGDVTNVQVDAIVNAANEQLLHGGGVAGAIVRKGGFQIQDESNKITRSRGWLKVGETVETSGGRLPCRYVIHAVGPRWNEHGKKASKSLLRQACLASLNLAALKLQLSSIALTAISSGIFGMPKDICAQVIFKAVEEFSESPNAEFSTLRDVRIVIIDEPTIRVFSEEFIKRYNRNEESPGIVFKPERALDEGGQTSMATNPTKENDLLPSADKEMPCNENVNLDTGKVNLSGKTASMDENSYEITVSDGLKKMSLSGEEDTKNARSESSLIAERRPNVDSPQIKSSCSGNNNVTGKIPRGRGRGLLAVTEEGKKLAKELKNGVEDMTYNSADVTEPVKNITESSGPNPQNANNSHESHVKENINRYGEMPNDGSSYGGQGNDITLNQSLSLY